MCHLTIHLNRASACPTIHLSYRSAGIYSDWSVSICSDRLTGAPVSSDRLPGEPCGDSDRLPAPLPWTESAPNGAARKEMPPPDPPAAEQRASRDCYLKELHAQIKKLLDSAPAKRAKIDMGMWPL